jgi:hypothetical protein
VRSFVRLLPLVILLAACKKDAASAPATCESVALKLNELSKIEAKEMGAEWPEEKGKKKMERFIVECNEGKKSGKMTDAKLTCASAATALPAAQTCLR